MNACVRDAEVLANKVGEVESSDDRFDESEKARISSAAHRILNLTEPFPRADVDLTYHNH